MLVVVEDVYANGELMEGISRSFIDFGGWKVGKAVKGPT